MLKLPLALATLMLLAAMSMAQDPEANLAKAKKTYQEARDKARKNLLDAFASASKTATANGSLDTVKAIQAELDAFENENRLPTSARMKAAVANYQLNMKQAGAALEFTYEQAIKDLTKAGMLAQAEAVQSELKEFRSKVLGNNLRPAEVQTKEDLKQYLGNTTWAVDMDFTLKPDGSTTQKNWESRGLVVRWEVVDRRTIVLFITKGRNSNLTATYTFSEDLSEFHGFQFDGSRVAAAKRKQ